MKIYKRIRLICSALALIALSITFGGCSAVSGLVGADGKPIVTGDICVRTANGIVCYKPNEPTIVEPEKPPVAIAAPVVVQPMAPPPPPLPTLEK